MKVFKQFVYQDCPVIIRQLDKWTYEYLLLFDGKFYGTYIKNKLKWWQYYRIFNKELSTAKETDAMIHFLSKAAETTIETLKGKKEEDGRKTNN